MYVRKPSKKEEFKVFRCYECRKLVTWREIKKGGGCSRCGGHKVTGVSWIWPWEWLGIQLRLIR